VGHADDVAGAHGATQIELIGASDSLDNASEPNLEHLEALAHKLLDERAADLERLASELVG
jgi:hypothetical protein